MKYLRAFVDRASTSAEGPIRFVAATEGAKADGIDLRMTGARLDRYRSNPVFLWAHDYRGVPIGRGVPTVAADRLLMDVEFDQDDEFARRVEHKYRSGFLNAVSVGFDVTRWEGEQGDYWRGGVAEEWELLELSGVPVPMDPAALTESGRVALRDLGRQLLDAASQPTSANVTTPVAGGGTAVFATEQRVRELIAEALAGLEIPHASEREAPPSDEEGPTKALREILAALSPEEEK